MSILHFGVMTIGILAMLLIDTIWTERIRHIKPIENSNVFLKWHEHYHVGLELLIISFVLSTMTSEYNLLLAFLMGLGISCFITEWSQDHPFAKKSGHFTESAIIGIVLGFFVAYSLLVHIL